MLYAFLLGLALLVGLMLMGNWFTQVDPRVLKRVLLRGLFGLIVVAALGLLVTGRLAWALAALAALAPWGIRLLRLVILGRMARQAFSGMFGNPFGGLGSGSPGGGTSQASSRVLDMTLNLEDGSMSGRVKEGRFAGRSLDSLSDDEALELWHEVCDDADSLRLLEAWLDRTRPQWREQAEAEDQSPGPASHGGPLTRREALEILGLQEGATAEQIKAAHRRLMVQVHPDRGGSTWMAAKLNEARQLLLGETR